MNSLLPAPKVLSTARVGKGTGRRVNWGCGYPQVGDGRIPGYWALSRVGTGMALTTAEREEEKEDETSPFRTAKTFRVGQQGNRRAESSLSGELLPLFSTVRA